MKTAQEIHFSGKVAQKALIVKGNKVLISRDVADLEMWELPGGRLNVNELPETGVKREVLEELGVAIDVQQIFYSEQFFQERDKANALLLVYLATLTDESQPFTFGPNEIAEVKWISKEEITHQPMFGDIRRAVEFYFTKIAI